MQFNRRTLLASAALAPLALTLPAARAQGWPHKPIRLVMPDAAGGGADRLTRIVAQELSERLGQQVVVDNKPGAGGLVAAEQAARSAPDGYTLFLTTTGLLSIMPHVKKSLPYDPAASFVPISRIATSANILVVNPAVPARTVAELVALAKASPGKFNYASAGIATPAHLAGEMLNLLAGIRLTHVPYKSSAPALLDVIAGPVQLMCTSTIAAGGHIRSGKVRALATTGTQRHPDFPELPTVAETLPGYEISQSWGIAVPAGTSADIVARLHSEIGAAVAKPQVRDGMASTGVTPYTETPQAFNAFLTAERRRLGEVIAKTGIVLTE